MSDETTAFYERAFWERIARGADVHGSPPYDVDEVASAILGQIDHFRTLDLGCGMGRLTNHLAERCQDGFFHGVDISPSLVEIAATNARPNSRFWRGDGRHLPPGLRGRFSGAFSVTMFQHIPHDAMWSYLRQAHDRLDPAGTFMFTIAVGDTDEFLNHQISDPTAFCADLADLYDTVEMCQPDRRGWTWVIARKAPR